MGRGPLSVLSKYRVLDFGRYIAGPFCATLLADFGAEVIRVEKRGGSEDRFVNPVFKDGTGAMFLQSGRNKKSITLNPAKPEGQEVLRALVASADVVVANLPAAGLKAMGLDYEQLKAIKPDIILTAVSAFGATGPYKDRVGFDGLAQVMSGGAQLSGNPGAPVKSLVPYVDFGAAMMAAYGTVLALLHKEATGEGQMVDGSLLQTAMAMVNPYIIENAVTGYRREGLLNRHPLYGPADIVATRDGQIMVQVIGDPIFDRWTRMVGRPDLADDPRFSDDTLRGRNGAMLSELAGQHAAALTTAEALAQYEAARVPAGPVMTVEEIRMDPHVAAAGFLTETHYGSEPSPVPLVPAPARLSATPAAVASPPPELGQSTQAILEELGYSASKIAELRETLVV